MKIPSELIREIAQELEVGMKVFLNKDNLEIKSVPDWDDMEMDPWEEDLDEIDSKWTNFMEFTKMESREAFKVMEKFVVEVEDERFCDGLVRILNRKSPFANFKAEVESSSYRQKWFDFKLEKHEEYVRATIEVEKYEDEELEIEEGDIEKFEVEEAEGAKGESKKGEVKIIDFIQAQIKNYVEDMRPPKEIRDRLDIGYSYDKSTLELFEIRPHFKLKDKIIHSSFARTKFVKSKNCWKVYWMRASGKWELYKPNPELDHIKDFFTLVDEDEHHCFKG